MRLSKDRPIDVSRQITVRIQIVGIRASNRAPRPGHHQSHIDKHRTSADASRYDLRRHICTVICDPVHE